MKELLKSIIPSLTVKEADRFEIYYQMLIDWNSRINLTTITEKEDVAKKHFLDSLSALPLLSENASVIDIGTGAGFPGIPLLIMRPDLKVTLVDSLQKRHSEKLQPHHRRQRRDNRAVGHLFNRFRPCSAGGRARHWQDHAASRLFSQYRR